MSHKIHSDNRSITYLNNQDNRELQIDSEHTKLPHLVVHVPDELKELLQKSLKLTNRYNRVNAMDDIQQKLLRKAKALAKGKNALANGKGYLMPYKYASYRCMKHNLTSTPRNMVRIIYYKNTSTSIEINEALSILKSSHLNREKIEIAVRHCWGHFNRELKELFKMLDEKEHLDSLITIEGSDCGLNF